MSATARGKRAKLAFSKRAQTEVEKRIPWFEVDDVEYTMPETIPAGRAIELLTIMSGLPTPTRQGVYLVQQLGGDEALTSLLASDVTGAQWKAVIDMAWPHAFGALEESEPGK